MGLAIQSSLPSLWIIATVSLISFIAFSSQLFIISPLFDSLFSQDALSLLLPFNLLVFSVFLNYALCLSTDPGSVPKHWDPVADIDRVEHAETKKLLIASLRFCNTCRNYKPPRAHHCRSCKRCVLKMDHHCPWVNNCVGHHNYGHFIRFLVSVDLACWYHLYMLSKRVFGDYSYGPEPSRTELVMIVLNYVACLPVTLSVGVFTIYHLWALLSNTTTIEGWELSKADELRRKGRIQQFEYPFSLGIYGNVKSVLGASPLLWWCPQKMDGDGLRFPVAAPLDPLEQYLWPPRDLFTRRLASEHHARLTIHPSTRSGARPHRRLAAPYHGDWSEGSESDAARLANGHISSEEEEDDDDAPLSVLVARRNRGLVSGGPGGRYPPLGRTMVRRGSEGAEVRRAAWGDEHLDSNILNQYQTATRGTGQMASVYGNESEGSDGY